jgi:hypothetical protein
VLRRVAAQLRGVAVELGRMTNMLAR